MTSQEENLSRVFKTEWFAKAAKKARITDKELCKAIKQVMLGQADDLGGGVYKKRLNENMHRSIILAKGGKYWIYTYLYAKKDKENIDDNELVEFRRIALWYSRQPDSIIEAELKKGILLEICYEQESEI